MLAEVPISSLMTRILFIPGVVPTGIFIFPENVEGPKADGDV
jgi:hypothetical protein